MAEASSQQYCSLGSCWNADSKKHESGKKVGVPAEGAECRFEVYEWQAGGSNCVIASLLCVW